MRDGKTGFVFFNIEGHLYEYDAATHALGINHGRLLVSGELAKNLGRPADEGLVVGEISISTTMYPIEVTTIVNGAAQSFVHAARGRGSACPDSCAGAGCHRGRSPSMTHSGSAGTQVGLGVGTTSCNNGTSDLDWFALPQTDHPVIPQNLYRMSGGTTNDDRFEQIGQSWLKHAFTALTENACGFGCNGTGGTHLGVGCSDPYGASLNASQSRSGFARLGQSVHRRLSLDRRQPHRPLTHTGTSHRILVEAERSEHGAESRARPIMRKRNTSLRMSTPGARPPRPVQHV